MLRMAPWFLRGSICLLAFVAVARATVFTTWRVAGASMRRTLEDGDRILVSEMDFLVHPIRRGDTVIVEVDGEILVKRVVACPGDRMAMDRGAILLNGRLVSEHIPRDMNWHDTFPEYQMRADEYFLLGDHRRVSVDSRDFGPVTTGQVLGTVVVRFDGWAPVPLAVP